MSDARDAVIKDIHRLMESGRLLGDQIVESRKGFDVGLELLEVGTPLHQALDALNTAERRSRMTDLLAEFDDCRHRLRISSTAAGLEEGMTIVDIGRAFGISRQLAARFAKEVRTLAPPEDPPAATAR